MKKKNRRCCTSLILLALGGIALLFIAGFVYNFYIGPKILDDKRALASPPSILVRSPQAGDTVSPGSMLFAQATVTARNPIARVEVWLDGEVVDTQTPNAQDQTTVYAVFDLEISAGTHMLSWRAIDNIGLVGQSAPIPISGQYPPGLGATTTVNTEAGQSMQDIAEAQGMDPGVLQNLNPDLGEGGLPAGTNVVLPASPNQGGGGQQPAPANAPTPPLPIPPAGTPSLLPANIPLINLAPLIPALLSNLPAAPSHLQAGFENCSIRLVWNDNATNEVHFKVWMQALGGPPLNIETTQANPGTGQTWYELASPSFGIYSFWIEATNGLGGQPSEIAWVAVNDTNCGEGVASQLEIEALGMSGIDSNWDRIYCYLAIEGWPEKRVPEDDNQFLQKDFLGGADIHKYIGGKNRILIKMPADEEVTLEGDCWRWLGDRPVSMGTFGVSVPKEHWDNRTLQAPSSNYVIDFRIRPFGSTHAEGAFSYLDYNILRPYGLRIDKIQVTNNPRVNAMKMQKPTVHWKWDGDFATITGFSVYVDGALAAWVPIGKIGPWNPPDTVRKTTLLLPSTCGGIYQIRVTANSQHAQSGLSDPVEFQQPPCENYAEVDFEYFSFSELDDGQPGDCDTVEMDFYVSIQSITNVSMQSSEADAGCGRDYQFSDFHTYRLQSGNPNRFIVPIDLSNPYLYIIIYFFDNDDFCAPWGCAPMDQDILCKYEKEIPLTSMSELKWVDFNQSYWEPCTIPPDETYLTLDDIDGRAVIKYWVRGLSGPQ